MAEKISCENYTCGDCGRYGDLHSSCGKVRSLEVKDTDKACEDFTPNYKVRQQLKIGEYAEEES